MAFEDVKSSPPAGAPAAPAPDPSLLTAALNPASIAVIGASDNTNKVGGRPLRYLRQFGFKGRIYPINPNRATVQGLRSYPDIGSLPEAPELAVVATPGAHAVKAVDDCAARGVRAAIVMASGFGETTDASAIDAERAMVARAREAGMRLVGPNSQGLANFGSGAVASFSTMFLEVEPADGPVGIISQSGMMSVVPYGLLRGRGIGVRHAHASGNDADVSLAELALAVALDPEVGLLLLYIESIRDPAMLARAAEAARGRDVPVLAVKTGRTARGQAAARSHTGALANEDRVVDAFFKEHGIWRARDIRELVAATELYLKGWRPTGRRVAVVSNSGASCVMAADSVHDARLELANLADVTVRRLSESLPSFATATNPIDITAALLTNSDLLGRILQMLASDDGADLFLLALPVVGAGYDVAAFAAAAAEFIRVTGKPLVVVAPQPTVVSRFREVGVPVYSTETEAIGVLAQLESHVQLMRRRRTALTAHKTVALPDGTSRFLSEAQSLAFLASQGLPIVPHRVCHTIVEAQEAFRELGGPVVLKATSPEIPHKSDHGLVVLDIESEREIAFAFDGLHARLKALGIATEGVIVAKMLKTRRELMLGAKIDGVFGPVLMVGDGGRYVEALEDTALMLPPVSAATVRQALLTLRIAPLFQGVRHEPPLDTEAFCAAAVRLGQVITGAAGAIASIDINPVFVGSQGEGIVIVDALVERAADAAQVPHAETRARFAAAGRDPGSA